MAAPRNNLTCAARSLVAEAFGDVLEGARKRRDLHPDQVAARAGIRIAHLFMIEHAHTKPRLNVLFRVADAVGVSPTWLLDEVIAWLVPYANLPDEGVACLRITDQESRFIHQLIGAAPACPWR
jgi:transcriptional regulator with XRE-family HTH domain